MAKRADETKMRQIVESVRNGEPVSVDDFASLLQQWKAEALSETPESGSHMMDHSHQDAAEAKRIARAKRRKRRRLDNERLTAEARFWQGPRTAEQRLDNHRPIDAPARHVLSRKSSKGKPPKGE